MNSNESPVQQPTNQTGMSRKTKLALWLMIGPSALIVVVFMLFAILNWVIGATAPTPIEGEVFTESPFSVVVTIGNVLLFLAGAVSVITFLPGLIAGIVLLATRK